MPAPYRQLIQVQSYQIEAGLVCGVTLSSIAKQIGVHATTLNRELQKNRSAYAQVFRSPVTRTTRRLAHVFVHAAWHPRYRNRARDQRRRRRLQSHAIVLVAFRLIVTMMPPRDQR